MTLCGRWDCVRTSRRHADEEAERQFNLSLHNHTDVLSNKFIFKSLKYVHVFYRPSLPYKNYFALAINWVTEASVCGKNILKSKWYKNEKGLWKGLTPWIIRVIGSDINLILRWLLRSISARFQSSFSKPCILRKSWQVFHDRSLLGNCCRGFVLRVLEYCSAVWCLATDTHLNLLDLVVSRARLLITWECVWVWHCSSTSCGSIIYAA